MVRLVRMFLLLVAPAAEPERADTLEVPLDVLDERPQRSRWGHPNPSLRWDFHDEITESVRQIR
jgi:hypothetical protein